MYLPPWRNYDKCVYLAPPAVQDVVDTNYPIKMYHLGCVYVTEQYSLTDCL